MKKRLLSLFLAVVTLFSCAYTGVYAAEADTAELSLTVTPTLEGEKVKVAVGFENNPGFAGINLAIAFDKTKVTPESYVANGDLGALQSISNMDESGVDLTALDEVTFVSMFMGDYSEESGNLAEFTFALKEGVSGGTLNFDATCSVNSADGEVVECNSSSGNLFLGEEEFFATLSLSSISAAPGEEFTVDVSVSDNMGFAGVEYEIAFDNTLITPVSVTTGEVSEGLDFSSNLLDPSIDKSSLEAVTGVLISAENITSNGVIATYTFTVRKDALACETYLDFVTDETECINENYNPVTVTHVNGAVSVISEFAAEGDYIYYTDANGYATIVDYIGAGGDIVIPSTLGGKNVVAIGQGVFSENASLKSVIIPEGVLFIDEAAFVSCTAMSSVQLPGTLAAIAQFAFYGCSSLTEITIPDSVTSIGSGAFYGCEALGGVTLSSNLSEIGDSVFAWCTSLENIELPDSVKAIGSTAFYRCTSLANVKLPANLESIGGNAFNMCISLSDIALPEALKSIGDSAFAYCLSLRTVKIPKSVSSIGTYAFIFCDALESFDVADGNSTYFDYDGVLFTLSQLIQYPAAKSGTSYTVPGSIPMIAGYAFNGCSSLTELKLEEGVKYIEFAAFAGCTGLESIDLPLSLESVGESAFKDCSSLTSVCFNGTESVWSAVSIGAENDPLLSAAIEFNYKKLKLSFSNVKFVSGDEFTVDVKISDNPGFCGLCYDISFDNEIINPVSVTLSSDFARQGFDHLSNIQQPSVDLSSFDYVTSSFYSIYDTAYEGVIATYRFKVKDEAGFFGSELVFSKYETVNSALEYVATVLESYTIDLPVMPDIDSITFTDAMFTYDGEPHSVYAENIPEGAAVSYSVSNVVSAGRYNVEATVLKDGYRPYKISACMTIQPKVLTADISAVSREYNGTNQIQIAGGKLIGVIAGDDVSIENIPSFGTVQDKNVGTNKAVTIDTLKLCGADAANYTLTQPTLAADISILAVYVTPVSGQCNIYTQTPGNIAYTYATSQGKLYELGISFEGVLAIDGSFDTIGEYNITIGTLTLSDTSNASVNFTSGVKYNVLDKMPQNVEVSVPSGDKTYGDDDFTVSYNVIEGNTDGILSFMSTDESVLTVDQNGIVSIVGGGKADIVLSLPGNALYADYLFSISVTVNPKTVKVALTPSDAVYGNAPAISGTEDYSGIFELNKAAFAGLDVGSYTLDSSYLTYNEKNYTLIVAPAVFNITPKAITVSGIVAKPVVVGNVPVIDTVKSSPVLSGVLLGDIVEANLENAVLSIPVDGKTTVSNIVLTGKDAANYTAAEAVIDVKVYPAVPYEYTVNSDDTVTITKYIGEDSDVAVPEFINDKPVKAIGYRAFVNCNTVTSLTIPGSVKTIEESAFAGCSALGNVVISEGCESIGSVAFADCTSLTEIHIPLSVKNIGDSAFDGCTAISTVYYGGTRKTWETALTIGSSNVYLIKAEIIYEGTESCVHVYEITEQTEPTCTASGTKTEFCDLCYNTLISEIPALGHDYSSEWTVDREATCEANGSKSHHCLRCQSKSDITAIPALGHDFGEWETVREATKINEGVKVSVCSRCSAEKREKIDRLPLDSDDNYGTVKFRVVDAQKLTPLSGANIYVSTENDGDITLKTGADGTVSAVLPVGALPVSAYADGKITRNITINVAKGENVIPDIGLGSRPAVSGSLTYKEMTKQEIIDAGIDVNADGNNHVVKYTTTLTFAPGIDSISITSYFRSKDDGEGGNTGVSGRPGGGVYAGGYVGQSGTVSKPGTGIKTNLSDGTPITIYPVSERCYMIVYGQVRWLKEMYDVELLVINESATDTVENCTATLSLPKGLSLAEMTLGEQSLTKEIAFIDKASSESIHWYVRGDEEGEYTMSANVKGTLMPFNEAFEYTFSTGNPLKVYAGSALHMTYTVPDSAFKADNYTIKIALENVSHKPIYNLTHMITGFEQGKLIHIGENGNEKETVYVKKDQSVKLSADYLAPGEKLVLEIETNVMFESQIIQNKLEKLIGLVDNIEGLSKFIGIFSKLFNLLGSYASMADDACKAIGKVTVRGFADDTIEIAKAKSQIFDALEQIMNILSKGDSKSIALMGKIKDSHSFKVAELIGEMNGSGKVYEFGSLIELVQVADSLRTMVMPSKSENAKDSFDLFDSLRTAISLIPVRFRLENVLMTTLEGSTTEIPYSVEYERVGARYFGVDNISMYFKALISSACGEVLDEYSWGLFSKIYGTSMYEYVKATEDKALAFAARPATGDTEFRAYFVPSSGNATGKYTLYSDKDGAVFENGVLTFTGDGVFEFTPHAEMTGTLHIENGGNKEIINIDTVKPHTCSGSEWVITIPATADFDGYAVKLCDKCGEVCEFKTISLCDEHSFGEYVCELEATTEHCGIETRSCSVCGYSETKENPKLVSEFTVGDVNDDGRINVGDLVLLAQYFANWDVEINSDAADTDADGELLITDIVRLAQYLAGWQVVLG